MRGETWRGDWRQRASKVMGTNLGDPTDQVEPNSTEKCITLLRTGRESVRIVVVTKRGNARGAKDPYHKHALNNNLEADCQMAVTETKVRLPEEEWEALKVQRLRTKLADKAKREPKFRFYILYEHIKRMDVLKLAWKEVKKNAGGPGVDNVVSKTSTMKERSHNSWKRSSVNFTRKHTFLNPLKGYLYPSQMASCDR